VARKKGGSTKKEHVKMDHARKDKIQNESIQEHINVTPIEEKMKKIV